MLSKGIIDRIKDHVENNVNVYVAPVTLAIFGSMIGFAIKTKIKEEKERVAKEKAVQERIAAENAKPYTLIKSEFAEDEVWRARWLGYYQRVQTKVGVLYFDADGNKDTEEMIATKRMPCVLGEAKFDLAKPGDTRTKSGWESLLSHDGEDTCRPEGKQKENIFWHKLNWDKVNSR